MKNIFYNSYIIYHNKILILNFYSRKVCFLLFIFFSILYYQILLKKYNINLFNEFFKFKIKFDLPLNYKLEKKLKIGIYSFCIKNGGRARITALLVNYFEKVKFFNIFLLTRKAIQENEYFIPQNIQRIIINNNLFKIIIKKKIDILIYNLSNDYEINLLNNLKNLKTIFYIHSSIFNRIYSNFSSFKKLYQCYSNSEYIISIIPFENDFLFRNWGINSLLMNNFITFDYNYVISSDLSSKIILMIGRAYDKRKRFSLGIQSMEYIIKEIPDCELKIISNLTNIHSLQNICKNLNLFNNIKFIEYTSIPEIYFRNISLHIFPSISEGFPLVLSETKIYGIPTILLGIDYVSIVKGGTIIIFDDLPETIAKETIKILKNYKYNKKLGIEARKSMKELNNEFLFKKWINLIISIYNNKSFYHNLRKKEKKISINSALNNL